MTKINKVDAYIDISKLLDMGEDELAGKLLKIAGDVAPLQCDFCYVPTIAPKNARNTNATIYRAKKRLKRAF